MTSAFVFFLGGLKSGQLVYMGYIAGTYAILIIHAFIITKTFEMSGFNSICINLACSYIRKWDLFVWSTDQHHPLHLHHLGLGQYCQNHPTLIGFDQNG
jgi:hypothetical protein